MYPIEGVGMNRQIVQPSSPSGIFCFASGLQWARMKYGKENLVVFCAGNPIWLPILSRAYACPRRLSLRPFYDSD